MANKTTITVDANGFFGIQRVLKAFTGPMVERDIADDVAVVFTLTNEQKEQINYYDLSKAEKLANGFNPNAEIFSYDVADKVISWSFELSKSECNILKTAVMRYQEYKDIDTWRRSVKAQLEERVPEQPPIG